MSDPLGLSVGTVNLVAVHPHRAPVRCDAVVPLFDGRAPEVGVYGKATESAGPGLALGGFIERIGDRVPMVAADGSTYRGERLAADALDALARSVGYGEPVCIAVPAHWGRRPLDALSSAVRSRPGLSSGGVPPVLVSDAAAAITALRAAPGLPSDGVIALCDFGGSGTGITLIDAAADFGPIGPTVRHGGFSGDRVDRAILGHLLTRLRDTGDTDPAAVAAAESLTRLRDECRSAKERLSERVATVIPVSLPGFSGDVELTRDALESIIAAPLAAALDAVEAAIDAAVDAVANLAGVAIVGGGANIPAVGARLSERLRVPVLTTARPEFVAATGAATLARHPPAPEGSPTTPAWPQDDSRADEPLPHPDTGHTPGTARPGPRAWYKRPVVLFGLAVALALAATGGLAYTLTARPPAPPVLPVLPAPSVTDITTPSPSTTTVRTTVPTTSSGAQHPRQPPPDRPAAPSPAMGS